MTLAKVLVVVSLRGNASTHLIKKSVITRMYLILLCWSWEWSHYVPGQFLERLGEVDVPQWCRRIQLWRVTLLALFTLLNPWLHSLFITRPVETGFYVTKGLLYTKVTKVIMYFLEYHSSDTTGNNWLSVYQLGGSLLIFTTNNSIFDKTLP